MSGIIRGLGDSISALIYLLVACIINVALDIYFVAYVRMGVAGVALATVISQVISSIICLIIDTSSLILSKTFTAYVGLHLSSSSTIKIRGFPSLHKSPFQFQNQ